MKRRYKEVALGLVLLMVIMVLAGTSAAGYTLTLQPDASGGKDSSLSSNAATTNYGTAATITVDSESSRPERGIVEFTLSSVPGNANIISSIFQLNQLSGTGTAFDINIYRVNHSWTESGVTWNSRDGTMNWDTAGGDYESSVIHATRQIDSTLVQRTWNITVLTRGWFNGTWPNQGMLLVPPSQTGNNLKTFDSSDSVTAANRPMLRIEYTLPPNVSGLLPAPNSQFNMGQAIEIAANVSTDQAINIVNATITRPGGATDLVALSNSTGFSQKFNASYTIPSTAGTYNVTFSATDTSHNINNTQRTNFTASDAVPPAVTGMLPAAGTRVEFGDSVQVSADATDTAYVSKGFANITYPNSSVIAFELSNGSGYPQRFNMSFTAALLGTFRVTFSVNDSSQNYNQTESTNFTVTDTLPPNVSGLLPPVSSGFNTGNTIEVSVNISDRNIVSTVNATITRPEGTVDVLTLSNSTGFPNKYNNSYTIPSTAGTYNVTFSANDTSNNINNTQRTNFTATAAGSGGGSGDGGSGGEGGGGGGGSSSTTTPSVVSDATASTVVEPSSPEPTSEESSPDTEEAVALFDVGLEFTVEEITPQDELVAAIRLVNFGAPELIDVDVTYIIVDEQGNVLHHEKETVPVEVQTEFLKSFNVSGLGIGRYLLRAELAYAGQVQEAVSEKFFFIKEPEAPSANFLTGALAMEVIQLLNVLPPWLPGLVLILILTAGGSFIVYRAKWKEQGHPAVARRDAAKPLPAAPKAVFVLTPAHELQSRMLRTLKSCSGKHCVLVSLNKTHHGIRSMLKDEKIDAGKFYFVDCVSSGDARALSKNVVFIPPERLDLLHTAIHTFMKSIPGRKALIIDNIIPLSAHNRTGSLSRFMRRIAHSASRNNGELLLFSPKTKAGEELAKGSAGFARVEER